MIVIKNVAKIKNLAKLVLRNTELLNRFCTISHTIQSIHQFNQYHRKQQFDKIIIQGLMDHYNGSFDQQGSKLNSSRFQDVVKKNLNLPGVSSNSLQISSIGVGTYKGSLDEKDDILQFNAIVDSLLFGINAIDTCSNFRAGRSEKMVGKAIKYLIDKQNFKRNQLFLSSKVGYIRRKMPLLKQSDQDIINSHCVHPQFLQKTLNTSLQSIGVQTLDVFYLNNFSECQKEALGEQKWMNRLSKSFEFMEKTRKNKKIKWYGMASWQGFRADPSSKAHVNLQKIVKLAENIGGKEHGFRFIQIPINIMMPQAFAEKNQSGVSTLQMAESLKINVVSCSPIMSGSLINIPLPANKLMCRHNGAKHLQFIRSIPSSSLINTLIGHKQNRHVKKNAEVLTVPMLDENEWLQMIVPNKQPQDIQQEEDQK